jgi:hypothetical protein
MRGLWLATWLSWHCFQQLGFWQADQLPSWLVVSDLQEGSQEQEVLGGGGVVLLWL